LGKKAKAKTTADLHGSELGKGQERSRIAPSMRITSAAKAGLFIGSVNARLKACSTRRSDYTD